MQGLCLFYLYEGIAFFSLLRFTTENGHSTSPPCEFVRNVLGGEREPCREVVGPATAPTVFPFGD